MDVQRPDLKKKHQQVKFIKLASFSIILLAVISALLLYKPGIIEVDKNTVWVGEVKFGTMLREVKGIGRLVPADVRWVAARTSGRVEKIHVLPGAEVAEDTLIMELSNPTIEQEKQNLELQLHSQEADFLSFKVDLNSSLLQLEASVAQLEADYKQARLEAEIAKELYEDGLESKLSMKRSELNAEQLKKRHELETKRFEFSKTSTEARINAEESRIDQTRARYQLAKEQVEGLKVRAGYAGVLQRQTVEEGQQINAGQNLSQVVNPNSLKAQIQIAERQAKDLLVGQKALVDMRSAKVDGTVFRIDPNVENGTVTVDVKLGADLPSVARPDLTVEGTIEINRIEKTTYVQRPVFAGANSDVNIFVFEGETQKAVKKVVSFGRASVDTIEILRGLVEGDRIILSDMQDFSNRSAVQLK